MNCPTLSRARPATQSLQQNHLLAALPAEDFARLQPLLEPVRSKPGALIHDAGRAAQHVYFPVCGIVSVMSLTDSGGSPAMAIVGNDGMIGIGAFMGEEFATSRAVAQSAGHGFRVRAAAMLAASEADGALRRVLLRYASTLLAQSSQIAVCNRFHRVDQQLCRLLLMCRDRWTSNRLSLTHERMANLLGVRREGVTGASGNLATAGLISYSRGCVTILDRSGLEARTCGCYAAIKTEADWLSGIADGKTPLASIARGA